MEVFHAFFTGLAILGNATTWIYISLGVVVGLLFGVIPGISGLTAMAILMPFIFNMPPEIALSLFVGICATTATGGSITAILLNIPGDVINAATLLDGFPMTQKGQAGRALGAALFGSALGGLVSTVLCFAIIPVLLIVIYGMTSADMVFVILMAFTCVASLGTGSTVKGLVSCLVGVLLAFVGLHVVSGVTRFTFGTVYLISAIPVVAVALGVFALTEMVELHASGGSISAAGKIAVPFRQVMEGCKDVFRHWTMALRSSAIGFLIGIVPGIGGTTSSWMVYGQAKTTSKHPEEFGKGSVEGIVAPESNNGATVAGDLLCTLALGIPGSVQMVLLLGALMLLGVRPGPEMMKDSLPLSFSLLQVFLLAKFIGVAICLMVAVYLAKIASIPSYFLVPMVAIVVYIGAYATDGRFFDLVTMLAFLVIGLLMKEFGFSIPAMMIGFILGDSIERYTILALQTAGPFFFMRPISLALIGIILLILLYKPVSNMIRRLRKGTVTAS